MARPKKDEHEKRSEVVRLRLTLAEHEHVRSQAESAGVTVSDYLRRRALGYIVPRVVGRRGPDPVLLSELNRIGVNLNQIARNQNSGRPERLDAEAVLDELRGVLVVITAGDLGWCEPEDRERGVG
jgi:hypothetical protein